MKMAEIRIKGSSRKYDTAVNITVQQVVTAMATYEAKYPNNDFHDDRHPKWLQENIDAVGAYEWAVWHKGKCYPGKYLLRLVFEKLELPYDYDDFHGGWAKGHVNDVFDKLGFPVTPRPQLNKKHRQ
jgi:hypothetical protein